MINKNAAGVSGIWVRNALTIACLAGTASITITNQANAQTLVSRWRNSSAGNTANRGMAYNPSTDNLLLVRTGAVLRFKASDGTSAGANLNVSGITGGTLSLSGIAVDADGVIYGCNLIAAGGSTAAKIYKWTDESSTPSLLWSDIVAGAGNVGGVLSVYGTSTNAKFILGGSGTNAVFVYNDGTQWTDKAINVALSQALSSGAKFVDFNHGGSGKFRVIAKTGGQNGVLYSFDPTAAAPITLTPDKTYGAPLGFVANGIHGIDYDPVTGLIGACSRVSSTSPFPYTNSLIATVGGTGTNLLAPVLLGFDQPPNATAGDGGAVGGVAWGKGALYTSASATGAGLNAYDITAFKVADPISTTNAVGDTATFTVASGGSGLSYQWYANGVPVSDGSKYSGTTTATLTVNNVSVDDAVSYYCVVTGVSSSTWTSGTVTLSIPAPPPVKFTAVSTAVDGNVHLSLSGPDGASFWIDRSSNLIDWTPVSFVTLTGGVLEFVDPVSDTQQFYRTHP